MSTVIIIGAAGDLGSQLADLCIDAGLDTVRAGREFKASQAAEELTVDDIVHLCVPAQALAEYVWLTTTQAIVVLHDSVMSTSQRANRAYFDDTASAVHMLMNSHSTVVIDQEAVYGEELARHFKQIGLKPVKLPVTEHDAIMASSQAPLALLCSIIHEPLKAYRSQGLLTPSGEELERALDARSAVWTKATIDSLLQNPQLLQLVHEMKRTLDNLESKV